MTVGELTMCVTAVAAFAQALRQIMASISEIRNYDLFYEHLDSYLNMPRTLDNPNGSPIADGPHTITFENVCFRYPGAEQWALRNINLTISPNEKLALVGENGSGKTTLLKLLCRLYDPTEGVIRMDGRDIRDIRYADYLKLFSAVFQDFQMFELSIWDNIALGQPSSDAELLEILRSIGLGARIDSLPQGLDTFVGRKFDEHGFLPSGGEAQKLALARALFRKTPYIILDEPTAALDPRAEDELYRSFDLLTRDKAAIYISHRLSSTRFCDKIAVLNHGCLAEYGQHDELLNQHGLYAELYEMQAQYYVDGAHGES